jgi:hypothetical protein
MWWVLTRNAEDEREVERLKRDLWLPPKGSPPVTDPRSPWHSANESEGFSALKSALGA